jgi:hypothetical protein
MLRWALVFGIGYVLGTKAGEERYAQIREFAEQVASKLEERGRESSTERPGPR